MMTWERFILSNDAVSLELVSIARQLQALTTPSTRSASRHSVSLFHTSRLRMDAWSPYAKEMKTSIPFALLSSLISDFSRVHRILCQLSGSGLEQVADFGQQ